MGVKRILRTALVGMKRWLAEEPSLPQEEPLPDISSFLTGSINYDWLCPAFRRVDQICHRPGYSWGVLEGIAQAKLLGYPRVSVIEFGVAGGAGLVALERIAELVEKMVGVEIDVYGFDSGTGLPKPGDYRDMPYMWDEGYFAMDGKRLRERLQRAQLKIGLVETTVPEFMRTSFAPIAFISIDLDLYTATRHALRLLEANHDRLLPRISCYFDDIMGHGCCEFTGERLAIGEFNDEHRMRKIAPHYGLKLFVPPYHRHEQWVELMHFAHIFDHPLYGAHGHIRRCNQLDVDGKWYKA
jgi:hypothetical protein